MAIVLGVLNGLGSVTNAVLVLFSQEVLGTSATEFALLSMAGAVGGVLGGWLASWVSGRIGAGPSLWVTMLGGVGTSAVIGAVSWWGIAWVMFAVFAFTVVLWNVITVSLRQAIIPDRLLGRVNSVYRFFGWGAIPVGALAGGLVVVITDSFASRGLALRMPWFVAAAGQLLLFAYAAPRLTTGAMDSARAGAAGGEDREVLPDSI